jgi:hypothetical protein
MLLSIAVGNCVDDLGKVRRTRGFEEFWAGWSNRRRGFGSDGRWSVVGTSSAELLNLGGSFDAIIIDQ